MSQEPSPVPYRGGGFEPKTKRRLAFIAFALLFAFWQLGSFYGWIDSLILPSPLEIFEALARLVESGDLWKHLGSSIQRLAFGWTLGTIAGLTVGFCLGIWSSARSVGIPFVSAFFPIPKIALLPLFIIWFGIGEPSKIATIGFGVFFPTVINTYSGVDGVPKNLVRMGQSFGLSTRSIIFKIILPGALPSILSGFRISSSIAIILLVAAEMIGAEYGVGALVLMAGNLMETELLLSGVLLLSLLGLTVGTIIHRLEKYFLRWR